MEETFKSLLNEIFEIENTKNYENNSENSRLLGLVKNKMKINDFLLTMSEFSDVNQRVSD